MIENMVVMMEKYSTQLEEIVAERTEQLQEEKRKTDALLFRMLPRYPWKKYSCSLICIFFSINIAFRNIDNLRFFM